MTVFKSSINFAFDEQLDRLKRLTEKLLGASAEAKLTFIYGTLLSCLSIATSGTLNRDGMLYVEAAAAFQQGGIEAAIAVYYWPFLSILMAYVSQFSSLSFEYAGYLLNTLFMGGTGALLVACSKRMFPNATWAVAIAFLAIPGINDYRHEIIREFGCWFFVMLGFWLAIRWRETSNNAMALASQLSILVGALFRPEALVFLIALFSWQLFSPQDKSKWKNLLLLGFLPALGASILVIAFLLNHLPSERLAADLSRLNFHKIQDKANAMSYNWISFAQPNALAILVTGSLALIPIKFVQMMGIFILPLIGQLFRGDGLWKRHCQCGLFAWASLASLLVLCVFVIDLQFLAGRYVAQWMLFFVPITGYSLSRLWQQSPKTRGWIVLFAIALPLSNVINDPNSKKHFREAGAWLKANAHHYTNIYIEDGRTSYYAGLSPLVAKRPEDRAANKNILITGEYDLFALVQKDNSQLAENWHDNQKFEQHAVFRDNKGESIVILSTRQTTSQSRHNPSMPK